MPKPAAAPPPPTPDEEFRAALKALAEAAGVVAHAVAEVREAGRAAGRSENAVNMYIGEVVSGPLLPLAPHGEIGNLVLDRCARRRFAERLRELSDRLQQERTITHGA